MVKKIKLDAKTIALVVGLGFAWSKLGLGAAVRDVGALGKQIALKPGGTCPAGWIKSGNTCIKL